MRMRLAMALVLVAGLAACGDDGDGTSGGGKTLDVLIGANTQYPEQFAAWQRSISEEA